MAPAGNGVFGAGCKAVSIYAYFDCKNAMYCNVNINRYPLLINIGMWPAGGAAGEPPVLPLLSKLELSPQKKMSRKG